jgi:ribosomal 50S subunit-recycling heat shock protein
MDQDSQELNKELQRLIKQRDIDAKAVERARVRTNGRLTDPSNRNFAAELSEKLAKLDRRIAEIKTQIEAPGE